jgi:hypothetical protein
MIGENPRERAFSNSALKASRLNLPVESVLTRKQAEEPIPIFKTETEPMNISPCPAQAPSYL